MADEYSTCDWPGVKDPWIGVSVDMGALQTIVSQFFRIPTSQCGPPVPVGLHQNGNYGRVYSFVLPSQVVVARLVAPVKPLFKTECEVAAMNFVRRYTSCPVPFVYVYCSESSNPVGAEWILMEHVPGLELDQAWNQMKYPQKQNLARNLADVYDQLCRLRANACGGIYHSVHSIDSSDLSARSPRWQPLSAESLQLLRSHTSSPVRDGYKLGPIQDSSLVNFRLAVPTASQTMPTFSSKEYVKLVAFNGLPPTRSKYDLPTREKCVQLFKSICGFYPSSSLFGSLVGNPYFYFSHGDFHDGNILVDPESGSITGIIDWEAAGFRPLWAEIHGVGWFEEDHHRFLRGDENPENFEDDADSDLQLRAFFRRELYQKNPDLFYCFFGGVELRATFQAAADSPRPVGKSHIYLEKYHRLGYWAERRGDFPWDMVAWLNARFDLDEEWTRAELAESSCADSGLGAAQFSF